MKQSYWIITTFILLALLAYQTCNLAKPNQCPNVVSTTTDTIYLPGDSIPYAVPYPVPVPDSLKAPDDTVYLSLTSEDTAAIIADYFATREYIDTLSDDTSFRAIIHQKITENRIVNFDFFHQNLRPTQIISNSTIMQPEAAFTVHGGLLVGPSIAAPFLQYSKNRTTALAAYDITNNKPIIGIGFRFK